MLGKDGRQEEKVAAEDEMVGWCHRLYGHELEQTLEDRGQGRLVSCSPLFVRGQDRNMTEQQGLRRV